MSSRPVAAVYSAKSGGSVSHRQSEEPNGENVSSPSFASERGCVVIKSTPKKLRLLSDNFRPASSFLTHFHARHERVRLTVWYPTQTDDIVLATSLSQNSNNYRGDISISERFGGKVVVTLTGIGAHDAAIQLERLPNGPTPEAPWQNCSRHHREWYCPRLSCIGMAMPNIDAGGGGTCRKCLGARPRTLAESAQIWHDELRISLDNGRDGPGAAEGGAAAIALHAGMSSANPNPNPNPVTPSNAAQQTNTIGPVPLCPLRTATSCSIDQR